MAAPRDFQQNTIALVYDFDGTLSPQPMQEYTVLPKLGISPSRFWKEVDRTARRTGSEGMLVYMRLLLEKAEAAKIHISREDLAALARGIEYYPGVESWFDRVCAYVASLSGGGVRVEHYIISAGMKEILEGISLRRHFANIFASAYHFDHHGVATFPSLLITDTSKTQFLFRINKGRQTLSESINTHMPEHLRPIPFSHMVYIGDGITDVPSMVVTRQNGGHAVAVYRPKSTKGLRVCRTLLAARRVDFIAPADYSEGSTLERRVRLLLRSVVARIDYERELFGCRRENGLDPA